MTALDLALESRLNEIRIQVEAGELLLWEGLEAAAIAGAQWTRHTAEELIAEARGNAATEPPPGPDQQGDP
jgi:hypothetical protein